MPIRRGWSETTPRPRRRWGGGGGGGGGGGATPALSSGAGRQLDAAFDHIDGLLGDGPHLLGETFTVADLYLFMVTRWCRRLPRKAWSLEHVGAHYARLSERPAVVRMLQQQGIDAYPDDF
jgi:glutathione S-transferase